MPLKFKKPFGSKNKKQTDTDDVIHSASMNPYIESHKLYNDLYGGVKDQYRRSRRLNFVLSGLIGVALIGMISLATQSKIIPYVVQVQNGQVIYGGLANQSNVSEVKGMSLYFLKRFISAARSVSVDGNQQLALEREGFALTQGAATQQLQDWYDQLDPFKLASEQTRNINLNFINHVTENTFNAGWTEVSRDSSTGIILSTQHFTGTFTMIWSKPSQSTTILDYNPFGFYITHFSWTEVSQ